MKQKVYLITPLTRSFPLEEQADYIGVDGGLEKLIEREIHPVKAIGDFDSLNIPIPAGIDVLQVPVHKDESDTELAIAEARKMGYQSIVVWGGLSGRLDHTLANIRLISWHFPDVMLEDERQKAFVLLEGRHELLPVSRHISFFALEPSCISLEKFEYGLDHKNLSEKDIFTLSNSFTSGEKGIITVYSGRILCIETNYQ